MSACRRGTRASMIPKSCSPSSDLRRRDRRQGDCAGCTHRRAKNVFIHLRCDEGVRTAPAIPLPLRRESTTGQGTVSPPRSAPSQPRTSVAAVAAGGCGGGGRAESEAEAPAAKTAPAEAAEKPNSGKSRIGRRKSCGISRHRFAGAFAQYGGWPSVKRSTSAAQTPTQMEVSILTPPVDERRGGPKGALNGGCKVNSAQIAGVFEMAPEILRPA